MLQPLIQGCGLAVHVGRAIVVEINVQLVVLSEALCHLNPL